MAEVTNVMEPGAIKRMNFEPTRGLRYAELFFVGPELIFIFNSIGLSEAPPELWDATDAGAVAQHYGAASVIKNGPHWWASDTTTLDFAVDELTVGGIGYRFVAKIPSFLAEEGKLEPPSYAVVEANKSGVLVYSEGRPVYELVSPDGDVLVMQSSNIDPGEWPSLSERLSPPEGWSSRTRTLDGDLTVDLDGHVRVAMDELHNVYNLSDV